MASFIKIKEDMAPDNFGEGVNFTVRLTKEESGWHGQFYLGVDGFSELLLSTGPIRMLDGAKTLDPDTKDDVLAIMRAQPLHNTIESVLGRLEGDELPRKVSYGEDMIEITYVVPPSLHYERSGTGGDFFDALRQLKDACDALRGHIDTINDPDRRTPELVALNAYLKSLIVFLEPEDHPPNIPAQVPEGIRKKGEAVQWDKVSPEARGWFSTILKALEFLGLG